MSRESRERPGLKVRVLVQLARRLLDIFFSLNRKVVRGEQYLAQTLDAGRPVFVGLWHDRLLYPIRYLRRLRPLALVSRSSDGDLMAGLLESWGFSTIRGSSTKGGGEALRVMMRALKKPDVIMVNAMDGPVGPAKVAKAGGLALAARQGAILIPVAGAASRHWSFQQSWDRFQVPKPFGRIVIQIGQPLEVKPDMNDQDLADLMERQLNRAEKEADAFTAGME